MEPDYLVRIEDRMQRLQRREITIRQDISHVNQELARATADIEIELEALKIELVLLDKELHRTVTRVKMAVGLFKNVAKKGDFARLQTRSELWAPHDKITRTQFLRMIRLEQ
jgi:predicted  nucleic acid-binding Zn-ribbon protein